MIQSLYRDKRAVWLGACHDIIDCIVTEGKRLGPWLCRDTDATRPGKACARQYGHPGLRHGRARPATRPGQACDTAGPGLRHGRARPATRPGQACDTAGPGLRHGRARPATRPGQACDTAGPGLRHGQARPATRRSVRAGWAGYAPGAHNQFWTQCIVSESLFGTLFMNTVHKIFQKNK